MKIVIFFCVYLLMVSTCYAAEISWGNKVGMLTTSSVASSSSHFVEWKNPISGSCSTNRTRFSQDDKAILSLLLTAASTDASVSFYYNLNATTGGVVGHGSGCQLVNIWINP